MRHIITLCDLMYGSHTEEMDTLTDSQLLTIYQERKKAFDEIAKILEDRKERYTRLLQAYDAVISPKPISVHEKAYYQIMNMDLPIFKEAACKNTNLKFSVASIVPDTLDIIALLEGTKEDLEKADAALEPWKTASEYVYKLQPPQYPTNDPSKPYSINVMLNVSLVKFQALLGHHDDITVCAHASDEGVVSIQGTLEQLATIIPHLSRLANFDTIEPIDFVEPAISGEVILLAESMQPYVKESKEAHSKIINAYRADIRTCIGVIGKDNYITKRCLTSISADRLLIKLILKFDTSHDASIVEQWFLYTARMVSNFKVCVIPWLAYRPTV